MKDLVILTILILFLKPSSGQIFSGEKLFEYNVHYYQQKQNLSTDETIFLEITGRKWKNSEDQSEAIWKYQTKPETQKKFKDQFSIGWLSADTTGIIENKEKIWIHPPGHNQYSLTEIAPFPDFRKNQKIGDTYNSILWVGSGWGDWTGKKIKTQYVISDKREEAVDTFWTIKATSEIDGRYSSCEFILSGKNGFVFLEYNFYNGDKMTMTLRK
jgi:hypothetical protein